MDEYGQPLDPTVKASRVSQPSPQSHPINPARREAGQVIADRYRLIADLGTRGMGEVWRAEQIDLHVEVALKLLRKEYVDTSYIDEFGTLFKREVQTLAKVNDPRIVQYIDHGKTEDGTLFMAMEWFYGLSLEEHLDVQGKLTPLEVTSVLKELTQSLESAHRHGLIHGDITPSNIFLTEAGNRFQVHILDFGIAKALDAGEYSGAPRTRSGMLVGSPHYMAPEQFEEGADVSTDLYALGVIAWQCLVGRQPFEGTTASIVSQHLMQSAPKLPSELDIPAELNLLIQDLLKKDPNQRPQNAQELGKRLTIIENNIRSKAPLPQSWPHRIIKAVLGVSITAIVP